MVQDLVLVGLADYSIDAPPLDWTADGAAKEDATASLLTSVFENIGRFGQQQRLHTLTLEVRVFRDSPDQRLFPREINTYASGAIHGHGCHAIWSMTSRLWRTVTDALAKARLRVAALHIFDGDDMQHCSLATSELSRVEFDGEHEMLLSGCEVLSLSLSSPYIPGHQHYNKEDFAEISDDPDGEAHAKKDRRERELAA